MAINSDYTELVVNLINKQTEVWVGRFRSESKRYQQHDFHFLTLQ